MTGIGGLNDTNRLTIAQLDPSINATGKAVDGIVTLIWPYSISSQTFSILLAEPDFRLRRQRGQVRIQFRGSSAKAVAKHGVQSGDRVWLSLVDAHWERDETASGTPGRGIEWELRFEERVVLKIQREDHEPIDIDIDHPPLSPDRQLRSPPSNESSSYLQTPSTPITFPAVPSRLQAWPTPAFLKRDRLTGNSYFGSDYDPFDEDEFQDNNRRKKTKFGRASNQWKFTEQSSSPESASRSRSPAAEQLALAEARNRSVTDQASFVESHVLKGKNTEDDDKQAENHLVSHEPLVDVGVQVDDSLISTPTIEYHPQDAVTSPMLESQSQMFAPERNPPQTQRTETEILGSSADDTTMPIGQVILPTPLRAGSPDQGIDNIAHHDAASSYQSSEKRSSNLVSANGSLQDGQRIGDIDEVAKEHESADSEHLPTVEMGEGGLSPGIINQLKEGVNKKQSQDERLPSPVQEDTRIRELQECSQPAGEVALSHEHQERGLNQPTDAEDSSGPNFAIIEAESAQTLRSSKQDSLRKVLKQAGLAANQESNQDVQKFHIFQTQTKSVIHVSQATITSPTIEQFTRASSVKATGSAQEKRSEGVSSQSPCPLSEQPETYRAQPSGYTSASEDPEIVGEVSMPAKTEEGAQARIPPPHLFGVVNEHEREDFSEEDAMMADESQSSQEDPRSDEEDLVSGSEVEDYYDVNGPGANECDDNSEDAQEDENRRIASPPRGSPVHIITIDDSDEEDVDVAQSQTDGATMSMFPGTRRQSQETDLLKLKQTRASPFFSSPPPLPETIPDSQAVVDNIEPETDVESVISEAEEVSIRSPHIERSISSAGYHEHSVDLEDGAEANAKSLAASPSPGAPSGSHIDPRLKNKALTPIDTQPREEILQVSQISLSSICETHNFPTPQSTQNRSSDVLLPASLRPSSPSVRSPSPPAPEKRSSRSLNSDDSSEMVDQGLVDQHQKLKQDSHTPLKPSPKLHRISNIPASVSPWFAPRNYSEVVPDSRSQSTVESEESNASSAEEESDIEGIPYEEGAHNEMTEEDEEQRQQQIDVEEEELPSSSIEAPRELPTSKPATQHPSTALLHATSTPPTGLRTSHAYYTPLANLPSHFNTTISTLSIVLASTPIARAASGPRDFHTTLFLTDPSSLQDSNPPSQTFSPFQSNNLSVSGLIFARLFRPSRLSLPQKPKKGDVVLLRSCAVTSYARTASLLSSNASAWAVFSHPHSHPHGHTDPVISGPPVEFGAEERGYVRGLWEWWDQLDTTTKEGLLEEVEDRVKKMEEKEEREKLKGRRLKGMGLRLAPGSHVKSEKHELRDGKEWSDDVGVARNGPKTPRKNRGVRHELRDGKGSNLFADWQIPPPSRTHSVTEGIEPYVDPERYDPRPALKCLTDFRTVDWGKKSKDVEESPLVSPGGTLWDDLDKDMRDMTDLRDKLFEEEERMEKYEDDEQERTKYTKKRREVKRKDRLRRKGKEFRLPVGGWMKVKEAFGLEDEDIEGDDDDVGEGGLGLWLKISLRRSKNQRQISPERSEAGSGEDDNGGNEHSAGVSGSFCPSYWKESCRRVSADHRNHSR
ncbi:MAG: hypothetical protein Q9213_005795 [Squamulea squamosa]